MDYDTLGIVGTNCEDEMVKYTMHFTASDGSEAIITGDAKALEAIEKAFERAEIVWNESVECWDEGYYTINQRPGANCEENGK